MDQIPSDRLSIEECNTLLWVARHALESEIRGEDQLPIDANNLTEKLELNGASFVTLTINGQLRGCIGSIDAYQPLVEDVREHAISAATQDYRFPRVKPEELSAILIEISYLTPQMPLNYEDGDDLIEKLQPGRDGVVISDGFRRATFLPQVWEKLPDPKVFLSHLCSKMGASPNAWQTKKLTVSVYQVQEFHE